MNKHSAGSQHASVAAREQRNLTEEVPPPISAEEHRLSKIAEALEERARIQMLKEEYERDLKEQRKFKH